MAIGTLGAAVFGMVVAGSALSASAARSAPVLAPSPVLDDPPVVSGVAQEGQTLSTTTGGWNGTQPFAYSYRWQRCSVENLITNPGFETDTAGWESSYGASIERVAGQARSGAYSLKVVTSGLRQALEGAKYKSISSPDPSREYRLIAYVYYAGADGPSVRLKDQLWGTDPVWPLREDATERKLHTGWNRLSLRFQPLAGTTRADLYIETTYSKVAITFYVDDVWANGCTYISGGTSSTYTVAAADAGWRVSSVVDAKNSAGSASFGGTQTDQAVDKWSVAPAYTGPVYSDNTAAAASDPPSPPPIITTLPTWRNLYDWPNGHGYVGWHYATSALDSRYGNASNLGNNPGLWLWPVGVQRYTPNYAEWTYTAPGLTRISTANLSFAYRNKLLAHHCIEIGLRTLDGVIVQQDQWCQPALPPDSQRDVQVALADSKNNPTAKVLYFRIELPPCNGGDPCEKYIPTLDPLTVGGYARLKFADMILVDDDAPQLLPSGDFFDLMNDYPGVGQSYGLTITAIDSGAGIQHVWGEDDAGVVTAADAPCDPTHNTPSLDNRICPAEWAYSTSLSTAHLAEGMDTFATKASDFAATTGASPNWSFFVDRTAPAPASDIAVTLFDGTSHATIGWDPGDDADLPDGFPGSGVQSYSYSYRTNGGEWTAWATTDDSSFAVDAPGGSTVDVEAQDIDGAGSTSASATGSVVIGSPTPPQDETDTSASPVAGIQADEPVPDTLPPAPIPMTPDGRAPAGSYAVDYSPASEQGVDGGLAIVTSTATGTAALTGAVVNAQTGKPIITATASLALPAGTISTQTNAGGAFAFANIPTSSTGYTLTIAAPGFGTFEAPAWAFPNEATYVDTFPLDETPQTLDSTPPTTFALAASDSICAAASLSPTTSTSLRYNSALHTPPTIRIHRCPLDTSGNWTGFAGGNHTYRWDYYVLHSMASEIDARWQGDAAIAVGSAVQGFAWYWRIHHRRQYFGTISGAADMANTTADQVAFKPKHPTSPQWRAGMPSALKVILTHRLLADIYGNGTLHIAETNHASGSPGDCVAKNPALPYDSLDQWGAKNLAAGCNGTPRTWQQIIGAAYPNPQVQIADVAKPGSTIATGLPKVHFRRSSTGSVVVTFVSRYRASHRWSTIGWDYLVMKCTESSLSNCSQRWSPAFDTAKYWLPRLYWSFTPTQCAFYEVRASNPAGSSPFVPIRTDNDLTAKTPSQICP